VFIAHFRELSGVVHHNMDFLQGGGTVVPWSMDGDEGWFDSRYSALYHQRVLLHLERRRICTLRLLSSSAHFFKRGSSSIPPVYFFR
jgi:hypothetical protein